jgi:rhodanese-related sulfurtransferase
MSNPFGIPEISVQEVAAKRANGDEFILLDVRENSELLFASLGDAVTILPLSQLAAEQLTALPDEIANNKEAEIVVMCHHGNRSAQVAAWLKQQGWKNVLNMAGGIEAYAVEIDPSIGRY